MCSSPKVLIKASASDCCPSMSVAATVYFLHLPHRAVSTVRKLSIRCRCPGTKTSTSHEAGEEGTLPLPLHPIPQSNRTRKCQGCARSEVSGMSPAVHFADSLALVVLRGSFVPLRSFCTGHWTHLQILRELVAQFGFGGNFLLASCVDLRSRASRAAYQGSDGCPLTASEQRAQHCAYRSSATNVFGGAFVGTQAIFGGSLVLVVNGSVFRLP